MVQRIKEQPKGYLRPITHDVIFCDGCGRRINWCVPHPKGQFCDKCFQLVKQNKLDANCQNGGSK